MKIEKEKVLKDATILKEAYDKLMNICDTDSEEVEYDAVWEVYEFLDENGFEPY